MENFFFLFSGPKISQIFYNPVKEIGKLFFELCFTKCLLSIFFCFIISNVIVEMQFKVLDEIKRSCFFKKKRKRKKIGKNENWKELQQSQKTKLKVNSSKGKICVSKSCPQINSPFENRGRLTCQNLQSIYFFNVTLQINFRK